MSNIWYKRVGFYNNPFSIKPAAYNDNVVGLGNTIDDISYAILTKKPVFIEGEYGQGKTTILKRLLNDFGGKKQVAYFSCNRLNGRLDVEKLLNKRYGFLGKLFNLEAKDIILLLDEAHHLGKEDLKSLNEYHKQGKLKSVVFVAPELNGHVGSMSPDSLVVDLKNVDQKEAVKIVRQRVGHLHLLSDDIVSEVFELSNKNVRSLLKNCEKLCKLAVDNEMTKVTKEMLEEVLSPGEKKAAPKKEVPKTVVSKKEVKKAEPKVESKREVKKAEPKVESKREVKKAEPTKEVETVAKEEPVEVAKEVEIAQETETPEETASIVLEEEEDDFDRQVKQLAMEGDDDDDFDEVPKRRKKAAPLPIKLEEPEEELITEEDYY